MQKRAVVVALGIVIGLVGGLLILTNMGLDFPTSLLNSQLFVIIILLASIYMRIILKDNK